MNEKDFVVVDGVITEYVGDETDVIIPAKIGDEVIKGIGDCAFSGTEIENLVISEGIEYIGGGAFEYGSLREITLPDSLREIGDSAFYSCYGLDEIVIPDGITKIGEYAFQSSGIKYIQLPNSLTEITECMFEDASNLSSIKLPNGIKRIGKNAFSSTSLKEIEIPDSVTEIGEAAFVETYIREFFLPANVTKVESCALDTLSIEKIIMPNTLTDMADDAFDSELDVEIIKYPPEKAEEFKPKKEYMYMLFLDTNIPTKSEFFEYLDPVRGRKSFWLYDSYEKAKKEMFGILDEYTASDQAIYAFGEDIPVKSFPSDLTKLWVEKIYDDYLFCESEDELENTTTDRMIRSLPKILSSYMKQYRFNANKLEKCQWNNFVNELTIENKNNPSLYFKGHWGEMRKLTVTLTNTKFDPNENNTCFYIHNEGELNDHWFHIEIIKLEVNEPRI